MNLATPLPAFTPTVSWTEMVSHRPYLVRFHLGWRVA